MEQADFNSRPSARGDECQRPPWRGWQNFNSRPSARGDDADARLPVIQLISIHAPPRGATHHAPAPTTPADFNSRPSARGDLLVVFGAIVTIISIHAPPRGATRTHGMQLPVWTTFQFTPLREGRHAGRAAENGARKISIHAPPRGATAEEVLMYTKLKNFNSRPSARGDYGNQQ